MKRLVFALVLVAAAGACKKAEQPAQGQMADSSKMMMTDTSHMMMSDSSKMMDTTKKP